MVDPVTTGLWGVELLIESDWAVKNFQPVYCPKVAERWVKLKKAMVRDGISYIIPQLYGASDVGAVVGIGSTLQEAIDKCIAVADTIEGTGICIRKDCFDKAQEEIEKFNSGVNNE
jgi:hypothetical protein